MKPYFYYKYFWLNYKCFFCKKIAKGIYPPQWKSKNNKEWHLI